LLIKEVVGRYGGRARFVSEDWGTSELAARFGLERYPVVFVDDVLVAQPKDFGGWGNPTGRYAPWGEPANQKRFQQDLSHVVDLLLGGDVEGAAAAGSEADTTGEIASLPKLDLAGLDGRRVTGNTLAGRVVVVEFWATWCPPCRSTLGWLGELERRYGDEVEVVAIAVESEEADVRRLAGELKLPVRVVMGTKEIAAPFGDFSTVPTLFVFDREGKTAEVFYGAPRDLHDRAGRLVESLVAGRPVGGAPAR
jgi:thiol-disulfide isomerase/thioredoxin